MEILSLILPTEFWKYLFITSKIFQMFNFQIIVSSIRLNIQMLHTDQNNSILMFLIHFMGDMYLHTP